MNFRDQLVQCEQCDKRFVFTVTEQRRLETQGQPLTPPTHCPGCRLRDQDTGRLSGQVKWFSLEKGYGFINRVDNQDVFFHRSQVLDAPLASLQEGTPVTFDQVSTERGEEAHQVRVVPD